jgi:predicted nuclease of predicted toxin-antitoxin system
VKFIVDNQLPIALANYLRERGFDCQHVLEAGLSEALDTEICRHADLEDRIIISKDEDFFYLAKQRQATIRVIWVRMGNCRTAILLAAFHRSWSFIESCLDAGDRIIEVR